MAHSPDPVDSAFVHMTLSFGPLTRTLAAATRFPR